MAAQPSPLRAEKTIELVRELYYEGKGFSAIGEATGTNKNIVAGFINRQLTQGVWKRRVTGAPNPMGPKVDRHGKLLPPRPSSPRPRPADAPLPGHAVTLPGVPQVTLRSVSTDTLRNRSDAPAPAAEASSMPQLIVEDASTRPPRTQPCCWTEEVRGGKPGARWRYCDVPTTQAPYCEAHSKRAGLNREWPQSSLKDAA